MKNIYLIMIMACAFNCSIMHTVHASKELTKEEARQILGVSLTATPQEISKAYKKLSLKFHPDKNLGNQSVLDQYKQLKPAFDILNEKSSRTDTGLTVDETFELYQTIQKINSLIGSSKGYLPKDIIEQQMNYAITAKNYKQELEKQKELLQRIKQEISDKIAALGQEGNDVYEPVIHKVDDAKAKVMYIFEELKNKYKDWGFSTPSLSNSMTIGLEDAKEIYKSRMKLADVLHDIKDRIQKHPEYFHPDVISMISQIESFEQADDQLHTVKMIIDDKNEEIRKIKEVFEDIKRVRQEAGLIGGPLPEPHQTSLKHAQECYKDAQFFGQCLQGIRSALAQNRFSEQFNSTLPESLKTSEEAQQMLHTINKEIERLRIEKETIRIKAEKEKRKNDFNKNNFLLKNKIEENKSYITSEYQNNLLQYFTSTENISLSDLSDKQVKESQERLDSLNQHIQQNQTAEIRDMWQDCQYQWKDIGVTRILPEDCISLDIAKKQKNRDEDAIKKIKLLNNNRSQYRSIATFGLESTEKNKDEIIVRNDNDIDAFVWRTEYKETNDKWAAGATVTAAVGAATAMAGFAVHNYFKNK